MLGSRAGRWRKSLPDGGRRDGVRLAAGRSITSRYLMRSGLRTSPSVAPIAGRSSSRRVLDSMASGCASEAPTRQS